MDEYVAAIVFKLLRERLQRENVEASVALSHEPDHDCGTCRRVRERRDVRT